MIGVGRGIHQRGVTRPVARVHVRPGVHEQFYNLRDPHPWYSVLGGRGVQEASGIMKWRLATFVAYTGVCPVFE